MTRTLLAYLSLAVLVLLPAGCFRDDNTHCLACTKGGDGCGEDQVCYIRDGASFGHCVWENEVEDIVDDPPETEASATDTSEGEDSGTDTSSTEAAAEDPSDQESCPAPGA
jgi:hypothetical protein